MLEFASLEADSEDIFEDFIVSDAANLHGLFKEIFQNDIMILAGLHDRIFKIRVKRDAQIGRDCPRSRGPNDAEDICETLCPAVEIKLKRESDVD
jgi:hypothetical protein